jgi:hypothetical protein
MDKMDNVNEKNFLIHLKQIVRNARNKAWSAINFAQIEANWLIGQRIVEQEQNGKGRAEYGKYVIRLASEELTAEFGKGFSETNLRRFRQFYLLFSDLQIQPTVSAESANTRWQKELLKLQF